MYQLLAIRRSIRKYKEVLVEAGVVDRLIRSMLRAPSGRGIDPWEIIYVEGATHLQQLALSKAHGAKFLEGAKQCLVVLADPTKTDVWVEDASIVMTIGHLAATDLGLGSCWIQIRNRQTADGISSETFVKNLLGIPEDLCVEGILAFGYSDEEKEGHAEATLKTDKVHRNSYGRKYYKVD